jgi:hypothetical protein
MFQKCNFRYQCYYEICSGGGIYSTKNNQRCMERCRCYVTVDHYHLSDSFRNLQRCQWPVSTLYGTMSRYWQSLHIRNDVTLRYGLYQCYYRSDDVRNDPTVQLISVTLRLNAKRRSAMSRGRRDLQKRCCANPLILAKRWDPFRVRTF